MKLPRDVSGSKVIKVLIGDYGWEVHGRKGTHVTLKKREEKDILTVPTHDELKPGLFLAILRKAKIERDDFLEKL